MKGLNAVFGWLLMLAVLAVPSFLFYNWWAKNKLQTAETLQSSSAPANVFPRADRQPSPVTPNNPQASTEAATAASFAAPSASAQPPAPSPRMVPASASAPAPAAAAASPSQPAIPAASPAQAAPAPAAPARVSTSTQVSWYNPKSARDPMLSPEDYQRIREAEQERLAAERDRMMRENRSRRDSGIENKLRLQGIVGNAVIINGEMYSAGQTIYGAKILKVGTDYIIGEYKGKKFKKALQ